MKNKILKAAMDFTAWECFKFGKEHRLEAVDLSVLETKITFLHSSKLNNNNHTVPVQTFHILCFLEL